MSTPLLFYEHQLLWNTDLGEGRCISRTWPSTVMTSVSQDGTRVAVLKQPTELHLMTLSSVPILKANSVTVALDLNGNDERVVSLSWSTNGTTVGVGTIRGRMLLFSSMGVCINTLDLSRSVKTLSSFVFLTENLLFLAAADGQLWLHHSLTGQMEAALSVHRHHCWPHVSAVPSKRICAIGGDLTDGVFNVTVWRMNTTLDTWSLLYSLQDPLSRFQAWRRAIPENMAWCHMDFSPNGEALVVSKQGRAPIVLHVGGSQVAEAALAGVPSDVLQTASDAVFWDDDVLALTTDIGRMLFLGLTGEEFKMLSTEAIHPEAQLLGRCVQTGILYITPQDAKESQEELRLETWQRRSPSEHVATLLLQNACEEALSVAEIAKLPKDGIYKEMWTSMSSDFISFAELEEFFTFIHDPLWIIQACKEATAHVVSDQFRIIEYGLNACIIQNEESADNQQLLESCFSLLRTLELLHTFEALHPGCYLPDAFKSFRCVPVAQSARCFAKMGNIHALQVLFKRHSFSLFKEMFSILLELPATMHPKEYGVLFPSAGTSLESIGFVSEIAVQSIERIRDVTSITVASLPLSELPDVLLSQFFKEKALQIPKFSEEELTEFYISCAQRIENETGNVQSARSILECGIAKKIGGGLEDALQKLTIFETWASNGSPFWNWTSASFFELTIEQRVAHILTSNDQESVMERIEAVLFPLCQQLPIKEKKKFRDTLLRYALQQNAKLFEELITAECVNSALFDATASGFAEFSIAVISTVNDVDKITNWDAVYEAVDLLSKQELLQHAHDPDIAKNLEDAMEDSHLGALLEKYCLNVSYTQLRSLSSADSHRLTRSVLGHAMRCGTKWSDAEWDEVLSDLMTIALRMSHLSKMEFDIDALKEEYFQTLLRASKFSLADFYMERNLDLEAAEEIAWKVGREVLCSITDLDSIETIEQARSCFDLFPSSQRARDEIARLKALNSIRSDFSVVMLPLQMEQFRSKSELIEGILASSEKHYRKRDAFLSLTQELRFSDVEFFDAWQHLCKTALRHKDLPVAKELLFDLRERDMAQSWTLALDIVTMDQGLDYLSATERRDLWTFIITRCDTRLQDCIEQMKGSLDVSDDIDDMEAELGTDKLACHDDAYLYLADASYRQQLKSQKSSYSEQKCNAYDFVSGAIDSVNNTTSESAAFVRSLLDASPHDIVTMLRESPQFLHQGEQKPQEIDVFEQHLSTLHEREQLQGSCHRIQLILPALETKQFCDKDNHGYRKKIIQELARYAGELLYAREGLKRTMHGEKHRWQDVLSTSVQEGALYGVDSWSLKCHFVCTISGLVDRDAPAIEEAVLSAESELMNNKASYIEEVLKTSWPEAGNPHGVAFIIRICARCVEVEGAESSSMTSLLFSYASKIVEIANRSEDIDFRVPIFPKLQHLILERFDVHYDWVSEVSELQHVYASINSTNYNALLDLYRILEQLGLRVDQHRVSPSTICLAFAVKQLLHEAPDSLESRGFWKDVFAQFVDADAIALVNFAVFEEVASLREGLAALSEMTWNGIQSWGSSFATEGKRIAILKLMLEESIEKLNQAQHNEHVSELEKWRTELKRLRRLHATQDLSDLGVDVAGDDFSENIKNVVRKMMLADNGYATVFEAVKNFAEKSEEESSNDIVTKHISETLLKWTVECVINNEHEFRKIMAAMDETTHIGASQLQESIWNQSMSTLKQCIEVDEAKGAHVIEELISVLKESIWTDRSWSISTEDRWFLFSCRVLSNLASFSDAHKLPHMEIKSFASKSALHETLNSLQQSVSNIDMRRLLDELAASQEVLGPEVLGSWLSSHYLATFGHAVREGNPLDVLQYLCEQRVQHKDRTILAEADAQSLSRKFKQISKDLWICLGMLLPIESVRQESLACLHEANGDASTLAILLQTSPDVQLGPLLRQKTWMMPMLRYCPPRPELAKNWKAPAVTTDVAPSHRDDQQEEKDTGLPSSASGDGWDIDDAMVFEEEAVPEKEIEQQIKVGDSEGWSDVEELETLLQADPDSSHGQNAEDSDVVGASTTVGKEREEEIAGARPDSREWHVPPYTSVAMKQEDAMIIGACCFPTTAASLVLQGCPYRAARLLSEKVNLHETADVMTSGQALLRSYFASLIKRPMEALPELHAVIDNQWFEAIVLDLLKRTGSICSRALDVLESEQ